jgi:hypothetical protein
MIAPGFDQHNQCFKDARLFSGGKDLLGVCAVMNKMSAFKRDPLPSVLIAMLTKPHLFGGNVSKAGFSRFFAKFLSLGVFAFSGVERFAQFRPFFWCPILNDFYDLIASDL